MSILPYNPDAFHDLTDELDAWRTRLDYRGPLPRAWEGRLRRDLEVEAVAASTIMEGVNVTVEEVRRILAGERPPDVPNEELELVEGYRDAMSFVLRRADDPAFSWDKGLVVSLHDRVLAGRHGLGAGSLRTEKPAYLTNRLTGEQVFLPPAEDQVPVLVEELCARMEGGHPHAATAAAWIHVAVAAVHPFRDGNGRCARILSSLAMYREGFKRPEFTSLEEWWGRHLSDYYELFDCLGMEFDRNTDVTPFITGHIEAQLSQVRALDITLRAQQQIWTAVEESAEDARLDRRLANALWDAFFGREVTAGYYRSLADVSPATATNDLAAAVASGLLRAVGQRRGRRYFAGEELFSSVAGSFFIQLTSLDEAREQIIGELSRRLTLSGEAFGFPRRPLEGS
ncbi:MAG TPA: Fic family protein [Actinomycetota bacterium]